MKSPFWNGNHILSPIAFAYLADVSVYQPLKFALECADYVDGQN